MRRSPSRIAQYTFDASHWLHSISFFSNLPVRFVARVVNRFMSRLARYAGAGHTVSVRLYGRPVIVPAEHSLAGILVEFPQYNRPLGLAAEALALLHPNSSLGVIDVGANVGETVEIIEQRCPNAFSYLCVEADQDVAHLCALNYADNSRVFVENRYIGENEGLTVTLEDDGTANSSVKLAQEDDSGSRLVRLDTIARSFAEALGTITLIKVDTEGYDFSVLRSARELLTQYRPAVYFEWYPKLLMDLGEPVWDGFEYLATLGYRSFVFFTGRGDYYCRIESPDRLLLRSLASVALNDDNVSYFDVFAATEQNVCDELVEASIRTLERRSSEQHRRRLVL